MAKIDTQFMTETAEKPYTLGPPIPILPSHTYIAHIREYPPGGQHKQYSRHFNLSRFLAIEARRGMITLRLQVRCV